MGKLILRKNGIETQFINGEDFSTLTPQANTYVLGFDAVTGNLGGLNPDGDITEYGAGGGFTGGTVNGPTDFLGTVTASVFSAATLYGDGSNLTGIVSSFTGNTSGSPINELHVCNVVGCSPITFFDSIQSNGSTADDFLSMAFGYNVVASGSYSHAEGYQTTSKGLSSHAEGSNTKAIGDFSTASGYYTKTYANFSNVEGNYGLIGLPAWTTQGTFNGEIQLPSSFGDLSSYFPSGTLIYLSGYGFGTVSTSSFSIVTRIQLTDTSVNLGGGSPLSIYDPNSLGNVYPFQGVNQNVQQSLGQTSHVEGGFFFTNVALGLSSHVEGDDNLSLGYVSHVEGSGNITIGYGSHAEGNSNRTGLPAWETLGTSNSIISLPSSFGDLSAYFNPGTKVILNGYIHTVSTSNFTTTTNITLTTPFLFVSAGAPLSLYNAGSFMWGKSLPYQALSQGGGYSHTEGQLTLSLGIASHAEGRETISSGLYSHAEGEGTIAYEQAQHVSGRFNNITNSNQLFIIGKGTSDSVRSNAFRVDSSGNVYGAGATYNTGADYAEYFESVSGEALPYGTVVELEGKKIKKCTNPNNAIGVISSNPTMVGNNEDGTADEWVGKYEKDIWGKYVMEDYTYEIVDSIVSGVTTYKTVTEKRPKLNPNYNPNITYIPRSERPEWNIVGLMGQIKILKNQEIPDRWIKMEDINDDIALYLVR